MIGKFSIVVSLLYLFLLASCVNTNKAVYFVNQPDTTVQSSNLAPQSVIQSNDLLSISVSSLSAQANTVFNSPNILGTSSVASSGSITQSTGYLVDAEGFIKFPFLGKIKASGVSESQFEDNITQILLSKKLVLEPVVNVRRLNFKITVLGEVAHPTVITVPNGKISLLEAIGLAGDLTIFARRDNVLLVREEGGGKLTRRINLNSNELFNSPYYYLKSNDVVYIQPNKAKVATTTRTQQLLPIIFSGLSFVAIVIDRLNR
ncbi:MAG: polysaccharide biosynthesis/export family protein [Chitinophagaceae bacterium]